MYASGGSPSNNTNFSNSSTRISGNVNVGILSQAIAAAVQEATTNKSNNTPGPISRPRPQS
jgi:hypothetical protein